MRIKFSIIVFCLFVSGCAHRSTYFAADSDIDKAFFYYEQDRYNQTHPLSNVDINASEPNRIPNPALVDLDSYVHIRVNRQATGDEILAADANDLLEWKEDLRAALSSLDQVIVARKRALAAYRQDNSNSFIEARRASGKATWGGRNYLGQ